ncbi:hypothetical protein C4D60_Mb11t14300 [Musa balbisiana]|uniref:Glycolipid transfer protein domain-containing protein n=1 Tax=Musa balbisiana TaxID=52838 RepID=A0A4S8J411_MUSBA|nr:hypothetical protein C4D60_Mb11t14300 [Musa balbisiana]
MEGTVFTASLEGIKHVKSENGVILTKPFVEVCKHILPVLDKFGTAMSLVKSDIGGNITVRNLAMDFLVEIFRNLLEHPGWSMSQVCTDSYSTTLKKWHGWLASSSFTVAMKLAPDRKKFVDVIGGSGDVSADMEKFCTTFARLLAENHKFLASVGLDDMKAS